jgi:hypothetical protein
MPWKPGIEKDFSWCDVFDGSMINFVFSVIHEKESSLLKVAFASFF